MTLSQYFLLSLVIIPGLTSAHFFYGILFDNPSTLSVSFMTFDLDANDTFIIKRGVVPSSNPYIYEPSEHPAFKKFNASFTRRYSQLQTPRPGVVEGHFAQDFASINSINVSILPFGLVEKVHGSDNPIEDPDLYLPTGRAGMNLNRNPGFGYKDLLFSNVDRKIICASAITSEWTHGIWISLGEYGDEVRKVHKVPVLQHSDGAWRILADNWTFGRRSRRRPQRLHLSNSVPYIAVDDVTFRYFSNDLKAVKQPDGRYRVDCLQYYIAPSLVFGFADFNVNVTSRHYIEFLAGECFLKMRPHGKNELEWEVGTAFLSSHSICLDYEKSTVEFVEYYEDDDEVLGRRFAEKARTNPKILSYETKKGKRGNHVWEKDTDTRSGTANADLLWKLNIGPGKNDLKTVVNLDLSSSKTYLLQKDAYKCHESPAYNPATQSAYKSLSANFTLRYTIEESVVPSVASGHDACDKFRGIDGKYRRQRFGLITKADKGDPTAVPSAEPNVGRVGMNADSDALTAIFGNYNRTLCQATTCNVISCLRSVFLGGVPSNWDTRLNMSVKAISTVGAWEFLGTGFVINQDKHLSSFRVSFSSTTDYLTVPPEHFEKIARALNSRPGPDGVYYHECTQMSMELLTSHIAIYIHTYQRRVNGRYRCALRVRPGTSSSHWVLGSTFLEEQGLCFDYDTHLITFFYPFRPEDDRIPDGEKIEGYNYYCRR